MSQEKETDCRRKLDTARPLSRLTVPKSGKIWFLRKEFLIKVSLLLLQVVLFVFLFVSLFLLLFCFVF